MLFQLNTKNHTLVKANSNAWLVLLFRCSFCTFLRCLSSSCPRENIQHTSSLCPSVVAASMLDVHVHWRLVLCRWKGNLIYELSEREQCQTLLAIKLLCCRSHYNIFSATDIPREISQGGTRDLIVNKLRWIRRSN